MENINRKRFICCRGQDRELSAKQEKEQKSDMESMKQYFCCILILEKTPEPSCIKHIMTREHLQGKESAGTRLLLRRRQERKFHLSELSVITIPQRCMWRRMECCIASMSMNLMFVYLQMLKKFLPMNCRCTGRYG